MMLPQHREQSLKQAQEWKRHDRPALDPQEQERIMEEIVQAIRAKSAITLTVYDEYEDRTITGVPISYSQHRKTLRIDIAGEPEWIHFDDVIGAVGD